MYKEKILKVVHREKGHLKYKGVKIRMTIDFSSETMQAIIQWSIIFKMLKEKYKLTYKSMSSEYSLQKVRQNKHFVSKTKADRMCLKQIYIMINIKGISSGKNKILNGNLDLYEGMNTTRNHKYMGKCNLK